MVAGGSNILVKNNYINNFCTILADGGGIYTNGDDNFVDRKIIGNVITNGLGSFLGTTATVRHTTSGIYLDELGSNVEVLDNTVYNCVSNGIYLHQAYDNSLRGNTLVNNGIAAVSIVDNTPTTAPARNNTVINNIFYAKNATQFLLLHGTSDNDLLLFGYYDSNYYCRPFDIGGYISTQYKDPNAVYFYYDMLSYKNIYRNRGEASTEAPAITEFIATKKGANRIINGTFENNVRNVSVDGNTAVTLDVKLDGTSAKISDGPATAKEHISVIDIGPVTPGVTYLIKFSVIGSKNMQNMASYVRSYNHPNYPIVSEVKYFPLKTYRTECQYLYKATTNEPDVKLTFVANGNLLPFWIDNVELTPVDVVYTNIDDSIRFEYNPTNTIKTVALEGIYTDRYQVKYEDYVTIQPYSSVVLTRVPGQNNKQTQNNAEFFDTSSMMLKTINSSLSTRLYPNPATNLMAARLTSNKTGNIAIVILDELGKIIESSNHSKKEIVFETTVNIGAMKPGLYFMQIIFSDGTTTVKRFVKR